MTDTALVTGASSGIGRALALGLAARGHDVVLCGRDAARLKDAAAACHALGRRAQTLTADLASPRGAADLARAAQAKGLAIGVLVNNAGFGVHGPFSTTSLEEELAMVSVHVGATLAMTKAFLPGMLARKRGRILNVGSVYAVTPVEEQAVYAATKAFVLSFSRSLAGELRGTGVTVTDLLAGVTRTEFRRRAAIKDNGRGMTAEAVAAAALEGLFAGRALVVPGALNKGFVALARAAGPRVAAGVVRRANRLRFR